MRIQQLKGEKINILHVISRLPVGGVENMLLKVVNGYDKNLFTTKICCIKDGGDIANELERLGYSVKILNKMKGHGFDPGVVTALYKYIKKENMHILRTHQFHANLYGRIAGNLAGVPVIIPSFHSRYVSPNKPKIHRRFLNYLLSFFSDSLIAVSNSVASDIIRYDKINPERIQVIYNGITVGNFDVDITKDEARMRLNLPSNSLIIGSVGRLKQEKGHRLLIEAASKLRGEIAIAIAGDGQLKDELKGLAESLKVKCYFFGTIKPEGIPVFLRSLDIFCFPSLWEGMPSALIEAMAAGLPIVASDLDSNREILSDAGMFVPAKDVGRLASILGILIDSRSMRKDYAQMAKVRSRAFSIDKTVLAYQALFERQLKAKGLL